MITGLRGHDLNCIINMPRRLPPIRQQDNDSIRPLLFRKRFPPERGSSPRFAYVYAGISGWWFGNMDWAHRKPLHTMRLARERQEREHPYSASSSSSFARAAVALRKQLDVAIAALVPLSGSS